MKERSGIDDSPANICFKIQEVVYEEGTYGRGLGIGRTSDGHTVLYTSLGKLIIEIRKSVAIVKTYVSREMNEIYLQTYGKIR